jgi:hypothetical protein
MSKLNTILPLVEGPTAVPTPILIRSPKLDSEETSIPNVGDKIKKSPLIRPSVVSVRK